MNPTWYQSKLSSLSRREHEPEALHNYFHHHPYLALHNLYFIKLFIASSIFMIPYTQLTRLLSTTTEFDAVAYLNMLILVS